MGSDLASRCSRDELVERRRGRRNGCSPPCPHSPSPVGARPDGTLRGAGPGRHRRLARRLRAVQEGLPRDLRCLEAEGRSQRSRPGLNLLFDYSGGIRPAVELSPVPGRACQHPPDLPGSIARERARALVSSGDRAGVPALSHNHDAGEPRQHPQMRRSGTLAIASSESRHVRDTPAHTDGTGAVRRQSRRHVNVNPDVAPDVRSQAQGTQNARTATCPIVVLSSVMPPSRVRDRRQSGAARRDRPGIEHPLGVSE